ncbi:hypothetical protein L2735_01830 [Shewanella olleyana]|uniref:hypothetical protein n=1 Tax=Shewanella olleyana TaxID=135626 RepID=UPI00200D52D7|nr:hypothetical protein [Shewanella olleyana]MCL1065555.1 hypothetical protein [Shewanella olleyana]
MAFNFETSTHIEHGYLLKPYIDKEMEEFPIIFDRFCAALYMATMACSNSDTPQISEEARKSAYLRASLAEFTGLVDILNVTMPHIPKNLYSHYKSSNALFHMLNLLRNYNIHLAKSSLEQKTMKIRYLFDMENEHDRTIDYISNLSVTELLRLNCAKCYTRKQLEELVQYFEYQQHEFEIQTLIEKGILDFSEHILELLKNTSKKE